MAELASFSLTHQVLNFTQRDINFLDRELRASPQLMTDIPAGFFTSPDRLRATILFNRELRAVHRFLDIPPNPDNLGELKDAIKVRLGETAFTDTLTVKTLPAAVIPTKRKGDYASLRLANSPFVLYEQQAVRDVIKDYFRISEAPPQLWSAPAKAGVELARSNHRHGTRLIKLLHKIIVENEGILPPLTEFRGLHFHDKFDET